MRLSAFPRPLLPVAVTLAVASVLMSVALPLYSPVWAARVSIADLRPAMAVDDLSQPGVNRQSSTCTDGFDIEPVAIQGGVEVRWTCDHPAEMRGYRLDRESEQAPRADLSGHWAPGYTGPIPKRFADLDKLYLINGNTYRYQIQLLNGDEDVIATSGI